MIDWRCPPTHLLNELEKILEEAPQLLVLDRPVAVLEGCGEGRIKASHLTTNTLINLILYFCTVVQRSPLFCANTFKKDPGRAGQKSLATAGTNFTKPGAHNKGDLCTHC